MKSFLVVNIEKIGNKHLHFNKFHLILRTLETVNLDYDEKAGRNTKDSLAIRLLLIKDTNSNARELPTKYSSFIGILNYLSRST